MENIITTTYMQGQQGYSGGMRIATDILLDIARNACMYLCTYHGMHVFMYVL